MVHTSLESHFYRDKNIFNELQALIKSTGSIIIFPCSDKTVQCAKGGGVPSLPLKKWLKQSEKIV